MSARFPVVPLVVLAACAVPPEPSPRDFGVELPEKWSAAPETATDPPPENWWGDFGDQDLAAFVVEALAHNQNLRAAVARLQAAMARATIAGADLWPQLSVGAAGDRARRSFVGLPLPGADGGVFSVTTSTVGVSLDLTWEIDLWGRIRAGEMAAEHDVEAAAAELRAARLSIAAQTTKSWFACVEAAQQLRLAVATAESFRRTAEQVRGRFETGVRPALDLRLALTDAEAAAALVEFRREQRNVVVRQLQVLAGRYPDAALDPGADLPGLPEPVPAGLPAELLARRPDLVAAERRLAATDARLAEARAQLYPRLSLTASGGSTSADLQDLLDFDFRVWSLGANILQPIFAGGRLLANVDLRDAERLEAIAGFGDAVLRALREVETALAAETLLLEEEAHRRREVEQARAARALSEDRYARGLDNIITLLASQRAALTSESGLIEIHRRLLDNRIDLLLALGGGFDLAAASDPSSPTQP